MHNIEDLKGKRIAIVGGAGFIGHNLALKLKELNAELTNKLQSYEEKLNVYAEKEQKEREDLLSQLDDQDKEVYGSLSNDQLRKHLTKAQKPQSTTTNTTQPIRDKSGNKVTDWTKMSPQDKRDNWGNILKSFKK